FDDLVILESESGAQTKWARQAIAQKVEDPELAQLDEADEDEAASADGASPGVTVDDERDDDRRDRSTASPPRSLRTLLHARTSPRPGGPRETDPAAGRRDRRRRLEGRLADGPAPRPRPGGWHAGHPAGHLPGRSTARRRRDA